MSRGTKRIARHNDVLARLKVFASLERKNCDEETWISLAYSCSLVHALEMIEAARKFDQARREAFLDANQQ